ncbi:hypothetical protein EDB89DRAFT_105602 [Lactarius sanguifluus]|nr:hypothetical protein EDB89DRAFT_105602 [Lactarius sanguifluus]
MGEKKIVGRVITATRTVRPPLPLRSGFPQESRLLLFFPHALCEVRRFPSRKNAASRLPLLACVSNVVNVCACARYVTYLSRARARAFFCIAVLVVLRGRASIEIGENGQRKRKIARFPCDRHPIEIGNRGHVIAHGAPTASSPLAVLLERGGVGTWHGEIGKTWGLLYWCRSGRSDHRVPGHRPCYPSSVLCWCHAQKHPMPPSMVSLNELRTKKSPLVTVSQHRLAFVWTSSGVGSSI